MISSLEKLLSKKINIFFLISIMCFELMLFCIESYADTYYMPDDFPNLQTAMSKIRSGDRLIIRDGIYKGPLNVINGLNRPPSGTPQNYTVIQAEHIGSAIFDGEGIRQMFSLYGNSISDGPSFIVFRGLQFKNSSSTLVTIAYSKYIKMLDCSAYDVGGSGREGGDGFMTAYSSNILFERCWSWGAARKHFYIGNSANKIIVRRCVARHDRYFDYEDQECFMAYDAWDVEFQNCIAIDGDQGNYYTPVAETTAKAFTTRYGGGNLTVKNINYRGCISLNNKNMLGWTGSNACNHFIENCIHWGSLSGNRIRVTGSKINNCTFGNVAGNSTWSPLAYLEGGDTITRSILMNAYYGLWNTSRSSDYNISHNVTKVYSGTSVAGANDSNGINLSSTLKYLVKSDQAISGNTIGANIIYKIGVDGQLWDEPGYNITTTDYLWPFPNEKIIKNNMKSYSYDNGKLRGNRGFCSSNKQLNNIDEVTLTSYILEYLGYNLNDIEVNGKKINIYSIPGPITW